MNWFKNLKMSGKLFLFSFIMILMMGIIAFMGLSSTNNIQENVNLIYNDALKGVSLMKEMHSEYLRHRFRLYRYPILRDESSVEKLAGHKRNIQSLLEEYKPLVTTEEDKALFKQLNEILAEHYAFTDKIVALVKENRLQYVNELLLSEGNPLNDRARKVFEDYVTFNEQYAAKLKNEADAHEKKTVSQLMTVGFIAILISFGIGFYLARLITKPVSALVSNIQQLAKGDFTAEINVDSKDEIGLMALELNEMKEQLSELIANVLETSGRVSNGSHEIAEGNQDLSQRTQEQASTLEEIASTIEEINSSIQQTAASTEQADQISQTTLAAVKEGEKAVDETMEAMKEISASSQQIADIIKVVNDIAFQTNLLALNAAVEAARAGEQGRGFAVVAAEVRNLAGRTAESSKEIEKLIKESVERVENGNVLVQKAGEMLKQIVQNTKHTSDVVVEISAAVKEVSGATGQIQSAIEQLNQVTQQNASMVEEIASSSESLNAEAEGLGEMVSVFKIKGKSQGKLQRAARTPAKKDVKAGGNLSQDKVQLAQSFKEDDLEQF
ncbi:MAG: methyl-accepting chemotaxis protein [Bacillota bacterium]